MKILFLTDNFPPEVNAPASRTFEHCREWVKAGHQVTVITCVPNFPKGKVFVGYRNWPWQAEMMDGILVVRVWSYITANEGFVKRILDYMSFMVTATLAAFFVRGVNVVVGTSPQFFTVCAAYVVSRVKRVPFIFELRDLWPESIRAVGAMKDGILIRFFERTELFLYRKAALIVSVTESFQRILGEKGIDTSKIAIITNGVDLARFRPREKDRELLRQYGLEGKFVAGYIGTHGMAHALETILAAARLMQEAGKEDYRFVLLGHGAMKQSLQEQAKAMGLRNLIFVDSVSKDEVSKYWSLLDVSIIHLKKTELFTSVIPSKLFECMAMGIPVLHGVAGESAGIVTREDVGLVFEPENETELCRKLAQLHKDKKRYALLSKNCLAAAERYDRSILANKMLELMKGEI
ncbi:glycosyltransferase WbuB [Candidatus Parcubacteria bacterium]|nr:MAG: glycosyltransferase WbuB [Candidatus Parcubacteria bacterium]